MSKGPRIKPTVKKVIVGEALNDHNKNKPRGQLAVDLIDIIERMGEIPPAEETIIKMISQARNKQVSPLDAPWSMDTLVENDLPAEAIPTILDLQGKRRREQKNPLTIREAWWASKLRSIIKAPTTRIFTIDKILDFWATYYALEQRICETTKTPFDTSSQDSILVQYAEEYAFLPTHCEIGQRQHRFDEAVKQIREFLDAVQFIERISEFEENNPNVEISESDEKLLREKWKIIGEIVSIDSPTPTKEEMIADVRLSEIYKVLVPRTYESIIEGEPMPDYGCFCFQEFVTRCKEIAEGKVPRKRRRDHERPHSQEVQE